MNDLIRENITVPVDDGHSISLMDAYLVRPARPGRYPGVLIGMEIFGITRHIRAIADRVARLGYVVMTPNFYHRSAPGVQLERDANGRARGLTLMKELTRPQVLRDVASAMQSLRQQTVEETKLGMVGFSLGGHIAYLAASHFGLGATAVLYGGWLPTRDILLSQPDPTLTLTAGIANHGGYLLFLLGELDALIPEDQRELIGTALRSAGVRHEMIVYPNTPHGFFCEEADTFHQSAHDDAWRRICQMLATELR